MFSCNIVSYLDRLVVGSFITITSVISPYLLKYSLSDSETDENVQLEILYRLQRVECVVSN